MLDVIGRVLTIISGITLIITAILFFIGIITLGQAVYFVIISSAIGLIIGAILWAL